MKVLWCYITSVDKLQGIQGDSWVVSVEIYFWLPPAAAYPNRGSGRQASRDRGPGGRTPSLERQHHQHALACERRRRGWVWMSTSSSDSVESQSRFPDVLWTQPNKRKETGTREPRQPAATTSWKHFSRLTSEVSDLRRRAAWPTLFGCL